MQGFARVRWLLVLLAITLLATSCSRSDPLVAKRIANPTRGNSVNAAVGSIRVLATRLEGPTDVVHVTGDAVGLFLTLVNDGDRADRLTAVSTPYAAKVVQRTGAGPPQDAISVDLRPSAVVSMQYPGGLHLELVGINLDVPGGKFLPVTFRFDTAGTVHVNVFVDGFGHPTVAPAATPTS